MNSSPIHTWNEFISSDAGAMYSFFEQPTIVKAICLLVLTLVIWFIVSAYRFESQGSGPQDS